MSKKLEIKLLAEAFDAIVNEQNPQKAERLFKRHWGVAAKNAYSLLESEDDGFDIDSLGDFDEEVMNDVNSEQEDKVEQTQLAIDELENKYPEEMSDEMVSKFDELRNTIDEMGMIEESDEEDCSSCEDAAVVLEDLKGDFEVADAMTPEVEALFDEISSFIQGGEVESEEEIDVSDDDSEFDFEEEEKIDETEGDESEPDLEFHDDEESEEDSFESDNEESEEEKSDDELIFDIESDVKELLAKVQELSDDEVVEEGWSNIADPRKKMTSEEEGVNKKGTMNFGKLRGLTLDKKAGLGTKETDSKGESANKKPKVDSVENKGAKQWHKVEKPANKPANAKSMMGDK